MEYQDYPFNSGKIFKFGQLMELLSTHLGEKPGWKMNGICFSVALAHNHFPLLKNPYWVMDGIQKTPLIPPLPSFTQHAHFVQKALCYKMILLVKEFYISDFKIPFLLSTKRSPTERRPLRGTLTETHVCDYRSENQSVLVCIYFLGGN